MNELDLNLVREKINDVISYAVKVSDDNKISLAPFLLSICAKIQVAINEVTGKNSAQLIENALRFANEMEKNNEIN